MALQQLQVLHRTHAGSKVANTYWEMNTDDASNSWEAREGL